MKLFKVVILDDCILHKLFKVGEDSEEVKKGILSQRVYSNIIRIDVTEMKEIDGYEIIIGKHKDERNATPRLVQSIQGDTDIYQLYHIIDNKYKVTNIYTEKTWEETAFNDKYAIGLVRSKIKVGIY